MLLIHLYPQQQGKLRNTTIITKVNVKKLKAADDLPLTRGHSIPSFVGEMLDISVLVARLKRSFFSRGPASECC